MAFHDNNVWSMVYDGMVLIVMTMVRCRENVDYTKSMINLLNGMAGCAGILLQINLMNEQRLLESNNESNRFV